MRLISKKQRPIFKGHPDNEVTDVAFVEVVTAAHQRRWSPKRWIIWPAVACLLVALALFCLPEEKCQDYESWNADHDTVIVWRECLAP